MSEAMLLTKPYLCRLFGRDRLTIARWVKNGTLPAPTIIKSRSYWRADEIDAFIEARRHHRTA
jgi:predicted DNA-binding transcriptional regulator AlpA